MTSAKLVGILGCPTVALTRPATADAALSPVFAAACRTCHGASGKGNGAYPAIPGKLSHEEFRAVVRSGKGGVMPAFSPSYYTDAHLDADFAALQMVSDSPRKVETPAYESWTDSDVESHYQEGLAYWRKRDAKGIACEHCHSPDGIDLAVIGYPDSTILRRAALHLAPEDGLHVVDFIHAQRRRLHVDAPCDPSFRPFQPTGEPLPGNTVEEQEVSFGQHLQSLGLRIAVGKVDSLETAIAARDELLAIDLRSLPIGIPLARWTEDGFNGEEHRSINDWIPGLPRVPDSSADVEYRQLVDTYLIEPTDDHLFAWVRKLDSLTNDGGFDANWHDQYGFGDNWLTPAMMNKRVNVLLAQHYFRLALRGEKGWLALDRVPYPARKDWTNFNPFFALAQGSLGAPCANDPKCGANYINQLPPDILAEAPAKNPNRPDTWSSSLIGTVTHPWFTLGQLFDQGLLRSGGAGHNTTEAVYWNALHFPHDRIHKVFFNAHRVLVQTQFKTSIGYEGLVPTVRGDGKVPAVHELLDGDYLHVKGFGVAGDSRDGLAVPMQVNVQRMFLYLVKDLLEHGGPVALKANLLKELDEWGAMYGDDLPKHFGDTAWTSTWPNLVRDKDFLVGTSSLLSQVRALVDKATDAGGASSSY